MAEVVTGVELTRLAREVTTKLGEGWYAGAGAWPEERMLHGPDQAQLRFTGLTDKPGHIHISGWYPATRSTLTGKDWQGINVAASRGAEVLAREITNRLLPRYLERLRELVEYELTAADQYAERVKLLAEVERLFGAMPTERKPYSGGSETGYSQEARFHLTGRVERPYGFSAPHVSVEASGPANSLKLELSTIPVDVALRMLAVLAAELQAKPER